MSSYIETLTYFSRISFDSLVDFSLVFGISVLSFTFSRVVFIPTAGFWMAGLDGLGSFGWGDSDSFWFSSAKFFVRI